MFCYDHPHPAVSVDIAVLRRRDKRLEVLLIRRGADPFAGCWALPGGFVGLAEDLDAAAKRELAEETGLAGLTLEQLGAFGDPQRDPRERVITVAYYGEAAEDSTDARAASDATEVAWLDVERLPTLAFDHAEIIAAARRRVLG